MKKTRILSLAAIFTIFTAIFCLAAYAQENTLTIYIDQATTVEASAQNGTKDAPYSKIETALTAVKNTEADCIEVFIMSDYQQPIGGPGVGLNGKTVKFTAESNETKFNLPNGTLYPASVVGQNLITLLL